MTEFNNAPRFAGASMLVLASLAITAPVRAQSPSQLPAVVVEQPTRQAARTRPASRPQQTARSSANRRAAARGTAAANAVSTPGARAETGSSPVQGYLATVSGTGTKTDTPLRQTAQSISVVGAEQVRDQGVTSIQEGLRYVPGVFAEPGGVDSRSDYPKIRGQSPNIYLDGTRVNNTNVFNEWRVDPYMLERIEVFRGPASVLYGDTSTAGLVNLISKRPQAESRNEVGVSFDNFGRKQTQMDSTGKLTKDGEWLYRFVGLFRDSGTQVDSVPDDRFVLSPSLTWRPTNNTSWTVLGTYQKDKTGTTNGFLPREGVLYPGPNGTIPRNRFVGDPSTDLYQTETGAVSSLFEHSFNNAVKFTQNLRYARVDGIYQSVYANSFSADPFLDASRRTVNRYTMSQASAKDNFTIDNNVHVKALTGALSHQLLFGVDYRDVRERSAVGGGLDATPFDLYAPVYSNLPLPALIATPDTRQTQTGLYAQDQMRLGPWLATLGIRQDYASTRRTVADDSDRSATTGRASLMYETPYGFNPYVTWAQSFNPVYFSAAYGGSSCIGGTCKDQRGETYEVGFKYNPTAFLAVNGAIYDTVERNRLSVSNDPSNPFASSQIGQVRIRGAEIEVLGKVTPDFDLIASYSYINAKVEQGDNVGKRLETVPMNQASLWGKYRLGALGLRDVTVGAGVRYIGNAWDETNTVTLPDYTLFDMMVAWDPGPFRLQINANNISDERYVAACYARGDCYYGIGRTVLGTATYRF
ncbi:TonB-dependent siderophore receptor [Rhodopseudomonas sp. P2A-2r]|uniref:TonB-dependent siderophore receptor n=1 Tax=Rhodopseudomonas sp. P2A-2r TaxID=2991972 RepID=UPI002234B81D|nr:TonB-dependent siderophore receptor [Rhodopseudomonas sp. P2A-2r]UZE48365.1 TonB-dependent siderophore receptor [Rhodopseudomonas sp. P2A-2r]